MIGTARLRIAVLVLGIISPGAMPAQQTPQDGSAAGEISRFIDQLRQQGAAVGQGKELDDLPPAIRELQAHGKAAVAPLADLLHDSSPWARWQAAWGLVELASSGSIDVAQALPALVECVEQDKLRSLHYPCVTALGHSGDARAVPVLRSALDSTSHEVVFAAMKALSRVRLAEAGLPAEIRATARRLEEQGRQDRFHIERFVERVLKLDADPRLHAAGPVTRLADAVERMLMFSRTTRSRQVRIALLRAAYEIGSPHAEMAVQALSSFDEPEVQQLAAALPELIQQGDADAAAEIIERWHARIIDAARQGDTMALRCLTTVVGIYPGDSVVLWTIAELADIGPSVVTVMLEELAESSQPDIRRNLVFGLGDLASHVRSDNPLSVRLLEEVAPVLEELLADEHPSVREAAARALDKVRRTGGDTN